MNSLTPASFSRVPAREAGSECPMSTEESGQVTGTKDKDYNIIWFTEQSLSNALRMEQYVQDAERDGDSELAEFFKRAQSASQKGADEGKQHLRKRFSNGS